MCLPVLGGAALFFSWSFLRLFLCFSYTFLILFLCFKRKEKEKKRPRKDQEKTKKRQEKTRKAREWSPRPNSAPTASCPSPPPSLSTLDSRPFYNSLSRLPRQPHTHSPHSSARPSDLFGTPPRDSVLDNST